MRGRNGLPANAYMVYGMDDITMQRSWIEQSNAPDDQKRIETQKLNALLGLCEAASCRRQILLEYFGDHCEPCGNCDNCHRKPQTFDGTVAAQKALSTVYRTGQRFGATYLIQVLCGENSDARIATLGHDRQTTFGVGSDYSKQEWQHIFRQLVAYNLLAVDMEGHGGLHMTEKGRAFLRDKETIQLRRLPKKQAAKGASSSMPRVKPAMNLNATDDALFQALKEKRQHIAQSKKLPAYVIFHDKTLMELAIQKPASLDAMLSINGIGEAKLTKYGEVFLQVIQEK